MHCSLLHSTTTSCSSHSVYKLKGGIVYSCDHIPGIYHNYNCYNSVFNVHVTSKPFKRFLHRLTQNECTRDGLFSPTTVCVTLTWLYTILLWSWFDVRLVLIFLHHYIIIKIIPLLRVSGNNLTSRHLSRGCSYRHQHLASWIDCTKNRRQWIPTCSGVQLAKQLDSREDNYQSHHRGSRFCSVLLAFKLLAGEMASELVNKLISWPADWLGHML